MLVFVKLCICEGVDVQVNGQPLEKNLQLMSTENTVQWESFEGSKFSLFIKDYPRKLSQ